MAVHAEVLAFLLQSALLFSALSVVLCKKVHIGSQAIVMNGEMCKAKVPGPHQNMLFSALYPVGTSEFGFVMSEQMPHNQKVFRKLRSQVQTKQWVWLYFLQVSINHILPYHRLPE